MQVCQYTDGCVQWQHSVACYALARRIQCTLYDDALTRCLAEVGSTWMPTVEPWTRNQVLSASYAAAALCCASAMTSVGDAR